jgi:hypothetical protein
MLLFLKKIGEMLFWFELASPRFSTGVAGCAIRQSPIHTTMPRRRLRPLFVWPSPAFSMESRLCFSLAYALFFSRFVSYLIDFNGCIFTVAKPKTTKTGLKQENNNKAPCCCLLEKPGSVFLSLAQPLRRTAR